VVDIGSPDIALVGIAAVGSVAADTAPEEAPAADIAAEGGIAAAADIAVEADIVLARSWELQYIPRQKLFPQKLKRDSWLSYVQLSYRRLFKLSYRTPPNSLDAPPGIWITGTVSARSLSLIKHPLRRLPRVHVICEIAFQAIGQYACVEY